MKSNNLYEVDLSRWQDDVCRGAEKLLRKLELLKKFRIAVVKVKLDGEDKYFILVQCPRRTVNDKCMSFDAFRGTIAPKLKAAIKEFLNIQNFEIAYGWERVDS